MLPEEPALAHSFWGSLILQADQAQRINSLLPFFFPEILSTLLSGTLPGGRGWRKEFMKTVKFNQRAVGGSLYANLTI